MEPCKIEHVIELVEVDDQIDQVYNYIEYEFEGHGACLRARAYVDEIHFVSIYGPFQSSDDLTVVDVPELLTEAIEYLRVRFEKVERLEENGYEEVY